MAQDRVRYERAIKKGWYYSANKEWPKAMGAFRAAIGEFPKAPEPYLGLGEACLGQKQLHKALDCFKLAARYSGGDILNLRKVADVQERMGHLTEAGRTYMAAGELLLRQREFDEAISMWQLAVRLEPGLLAAHKRLAMVFQRQHQLRDAVREYLAIARILQDRGNKHKALQMCQAALRLDPENEDILFAVRLIRDGEEALAEPEKAAEEQRETADSEAAVAEMVRQMAQVFASEQEARPQLPSQSGPVETAHRLAQELLAEEIFREDDGEEISTRGLSKLERDALIGQAMDFESRGNIKEAVGCYEKAMLGGLRMPAAFYSLGLLYLQQKRANMARRSLTIAAKDPAFLEASRLALAGKNGQ